MDNKKYIKYGKKVIDKECANLQTLRDSLGETFAEAVTAILNCRGKVIITGIGKSGIISKKIAATFSSLGTPSMFLHPGEAIHGDMGIVSKDDTMIAISNSGETEEILKIMPSIKKIGATMISVTCSKNSSLGAYSDITIETGDIEEADSFGIIPSSSTTCALVLGDAIALTLMAAKGISRQDFAFFHPGGNLGRRLMLKVKDVMHTGGKIPKVRQGTQIIEAVREIDRKNMGVALITDKQDKLAGIITDGDIRRLLARKQDIAGTVTDECMTRNPKTIGKDNLAVQALAVMETAEITCLVILDAEGKPEGIVHLHDLLGKKEFKIEY